MGRSGIINVILGVDGNISGEIQRALSIIASREYSLYWKQR